jgi:hypothetical protein
MAFFISPDVHRDIQTRFESAPPSVTEAHDRLRDAALDLEEM